MVVTSAGCKSFNFDSWELWENEIVFYFFLFSEFLYSHKFCNQLGEYNKLILKENLNEVSEFFWNSDNDLVRRVNLAYEFVCKSEDYLNDNLQINMQIQFEL